MRVGIRKPPRTTTPGSTAPVASVTCPVSVASWAEAVIGNARITVVNTTRTTRDGMDILLFGSSVIEDYG
jgi:hypothetical protein